MDTGHEPVSEVDMFLVNLSDGEEEEEAPSDVINIPSSSLSRNSNVMDESLDRHIDMITEKLLAEDPEPPANAADSGNRPHRSRKRKVEDVSLQQTKRVTRQKK
jgi:hypothetical protein